MWKVPAAKRSGSRDGCTVRASSILSVLVRGSQETTAERMHMLCKELRGTDLILRKSQGGKIQNPIYKWDTVLKCEPQTSAQAVGEKEKL